MCQVVTLLALLVQNYNTDAEDAPRCADGELQLLPQHLNASLSAPATDSTNSVAQPWNSKLEAFLLGTENSIYLLCCYTNTKLTRRKTLVDTNKYIRKLARPLELRLDPFSSPGTYICICIYIYVDMYMYVCMYMYVYMYVCMYVCMYVRMYVYIYKFI